MEVGRPAGEEGTQDGGELARAILGQGEVALLENAYAAYAADARNLARAFLGDSETAEDAVHSAFLEVLRLILAGQRWLNPEEARAAVLRNTRWTALKLLRTRRRRQRETPLSRGNAADDAAWARSETLALCEQIVDRLSPPDRQAIRLKYLEGCTSAAAADRLHISRHAFEMRVQRALQRSRAIARDFGISPSIWPAVLRGMDRQHRRLRRARGSLRCIRAAARPALASAAAVLLVQAAWGSLEGVQLPPAAGVASVPAAATHVVGSTAGTTEIDDAVLTDAVEVTAPGGRLAVVAVGEGKSCGCSEVFRSDDAGTTWTRAPGPEGLGPMPSLRLPSGYPDDARILILDRVGHAFVAPRFGQPFQRTRPGASAAAGRHPVACRAAAGPSGCTGAMLRLGPRRWLAIQPTGGVLCTADQGRTWWPRCLS